MTIERSDEFHELTFAQREGKAPLPEVMKLESLPAKFRNMVWRCVNEEIDSACHISENGDWYIRAELVDIADIIWQFKFDVQQISHDEVSAPDPEDDRQFCRNMLMRADYYDTLAFIEYILCHKKCGDWLYKSLMESFENTQVAYFVLETDDKPKIVPRINREAGKATRQAFNTIGAGEMDGAASHLRQSAEHINAKQYADAIVDSIHAVESIARKIDPKASRTLSPALDSLEEAGLLKHQALKRAFKALYTYTSDEKGLRHALGEKDVADVGLDEAIFMFGACASFAAYLTQKHRQANSE